MGVLINKLLKMNKNTDKQNFLRWLKDNMVYENFINEFCSTKSIYWRNSHGYGYRQRKGHLLDNSKLLSYYLDQNQPYNFFFHSFLWSSSDIKCWNMINSDWLSHLTEPKKRNNIY